MIIVPKPYTDQIYRGELLQIVQAKIDEHERSQQFQVGPSEIGGCETKLAWKLAYGGAGDQQGGWAAHKGTVLHAWLDDTFKGADRFMPDGTQRFYSDLKVPPTSPHVNGGTLDLYDKLLQRIIDWKLPGDWTMKNVRNGNLSDGYYVQANTYAYGMEEDGFPVTSVGLMFLPMCGDDLHGMARGAILRIWDYDRQIAIDAQANVARIKNMIEAVGPRRTMEVLPKKSDFCSNCPAFVGSGDRRAVCPGVTGRAPRNDPSNPFG